MDLQQYTKDAIRTESHPEKVQFDPVTLVRIIQAYIHAGRLLDMVKKNVFYKKPIDAAKWESSTHLLAEAGRRLDNGDYVQLLNPDSVINVNPRVFHAVIGIATEATELVEALNKAFECDIDYVNIAEEIGDLSWYQAILVDATDSNWDEILERNIAKLRKRYPEKFTSDNAINRDLEAERNILEGKTDGTM